MIKQLEKLNLDGNNDEIRMKIMVLEGKASNEYWIAVKYLIPKNIGFTKRTKKTNRFT